MPLARIVSRRMIVPGILVLAASLLYLSNLYHSTDAFGDEVFAGITAQSIESTGRDLNGRLLPVYFQMPKPYNVLVWFQPLLIYAIAGALSIFPLSESAIRLPMAVLGVIDILLMYLVGKLLFRREWLAVAAAALLALTPAHFMHSRMALEYEALLPFELGWLLCLLWSFRTGARRWLFGAGVTLGLGLYTYLAAYVLMPLFLLFTIGVLAWRKSTRDRLVAAIGGFMLPASIGVIFLVSHLAAGGEMYRHYQHEESPVHTPPAASSAVVERAETAVGVYASFGTPRLLFVSSRELTFGMLLVTFAGLLAVSVMRLIRRPTLEMLLLIAGLVCAPLPAVFVFQGEAAHRALAMLPFGILLGTMGLEYVSSGSERATRLPLVAMWGAIVAVAVIYHDELSQAQATVRAATVPLAVAGIAALTREFTVDRDNWKRLAVTALMTLTALEIAYGLVDDSIVIRVSILVLIAISLAPLVPAAVARLRRRTEWVVIVLAVAASLFTHAYLQPGAAAPIPFIPRSLMLMAVPLSAAAIACAAAMLFASRPDRASPTIPILAIVVLAITEGMYFHIDRVPQVAARFFALAAVMLGVMGVARFHRKTVNGRLTTGQIAATGIFTLAVIQFAYFYADYLYPSGRHTLTAVNADRLALSAALERARNRTVPAMYLANLGPFSEMEWRFYAIKNHRPDLVPQTIANRQLNPADLASLPPGSIAVVGRTDETDPSLESDAAVIARTAAGGLFTIDPISGPDGAVMFWVLERVGQ